MKKILIVGASGATGSNVVRLLLEKEIQIRVIVRNAGKLAEFKNNPRLEIVEATLLDLSDTELKALVKDCSAVISCLGHNLNFKGMYGKPRRLVTQAAQRLCRALEFHQPKEKARYILMNTTGNRNRDLLEPISFAQKMVIALLRALLPPHVDNEQAADFLRVGIGQNHPHIEWVAVRPDGLINEERVSDYELHPSPTRSALFDAGKTSRINVAHFMTELATQTEVWEKWKGQMPVIYNTVQ